MLTQINPFLVLAMCGCLAVLFLKEHARERARARPKPRNQMTSAEKLADYQAAVAAVREAELPRDSASWQRMMVDPNIKMGEAGGNCPVQIKLEVDDHSAYFRARGTHWSFEVAKPEFFAPCARESTIFHIERFYGEWPSAGWMTMIEASDFLEQAIAEFRSRTPAATSNSTD